MSIFRISVIVFVVASFGALGACSKGDKSSGGKTGKATSGSKLSAKDSPKVGDSCKGLSAADGVMACDGKMKMFCSSYSKYKWKSLGECKGAQKCVLGGNGKSVSCK